MGVFILTPVCVLAAPLKDLVFTEIVEDVITHNPSVRTQKRPKVGDTLAPGVVIQTGANSRTELVSGDNTVTRIGSNTVFSYAAGTRDISLQKGSVLFHSPTGKGGGNINTSGVSASVLGTTLIVGTTSQGGFKTMLLEGKGKVTQQGTEEVVLKEGQMSFALPGKVPSPPLNFLLRQQVSTSRLVNGFSKPVASIAKIEAAIAKQQAKIEKGDIASTGLFIGDSPGTAYRIDQTIIRVLKQEVQKEQVLANRDIPDPDYLAAVKQDLTLNEFSPPPAQVFTIDGSGFNPKEPFALPVRIPGAPAEGNYSLLIGKNITLGLTGTPFIYVTPLSSERPIGSAAVVALYTIDIQRSLQVLPPRTTDDQPVSPVLFDAGNTLRMSPGVALFLETENWIFNAHGSSYSDSVTLGSMPVTLGPEPVLDWDSVSLKNYFSVSGNEPFTGKIRVTAPSFRLTDSRVEAGAFQVAAPKAVEIQRTSGPSRFPEGFSAKADLVISAPVVELTSSEGTVKLNDVVVEADKLSINAGSHITVVDTVVSPIKPETASEIRITSRGNVTIGNQPAPETSETRRITTEFRTVLTAKKIEITAAGDIAHHGVTAKADNVRMTSGNTMTVRNADFSYAQTVALEANTLVFADSQFKGGSAVSLKSQTGLVAPDPGNGGSVRNGMVNFVRNVFYGDTEIRFSTGGNSLNNAGFQQAATNAGKNLSGISIGKK